ncbi:MAG: glycosyltransferase family 39 protein [Roseiflexus sp.]|nr:glycosyltransferase family 39 protein [Roseiflexus sp.]MDW8234616.1 glycosyltransferase family 39 protein [Roseiflexaceae bacterium]
MEITTDASIDRPASRTTVMAWRWALRLYAGYSALFILWNAWVSSVYPKWVEEASVAVWSPSAPLGTWLERVVLLPLLRYDVIWYIGIAQHGYGHRPGDTAFHPLYPFLTGVLGRLLGGEYLLAAWLVAQVCCVAMLALLYRLVTLDDDDATAQRTTLFLIGSPLGFAFLLPYTESLLLLSVVAALYAGRKGRWWLAGAAGGAAALTKQPGAVVLLPLLWELWQQHRSTVRATGIRTLIGPLAGLSLTPLALLGWIVYRATLGDVAFSWRDPGTLVSALLVTPSYADVWGETFSWPWVNFGYALDQLRERPYFYLLLNTMLMLIMLALTLATTVRARRSYAIYSLTLAAMNLSIVYPLWPYMGIVRRFTIIFPLFIQLARWGKSPVVLWLTLTCNAFLWTLIASMYVRNAFVP